MCVFKISGVQILFKSRFGWENSLNTYIRLRFVNSVYIKHQYNIKI